MVKHLLLVIFTCLLLKLGAQSGNAFKQIDGVAEGSFRIFESIIDYKTNQVYGHIVGYKIKSKLIVDFLDADLNKKGQIDIRLPRGFYVRKAILNGDSFLILIGNASRKTIAYTYTLTGEQIGNKRFAGNHPLLHLLPSETDEGYYAIIPAKGYKKRIGYEIKKLDKNLEVVWEKRRFSVDEGRISVEAANVKNNKIVLTSVYSPNDLTKNIKSELLCLNSECDTIFVSDLKEDISVIVPSKITFDKQNNIVAVGQVYSGKTERNIFSKGIFMKKVSPTGAEISTKIHRWDDGIRKQLLKTQLTLSGTNRIYLHDFVAAENGEFYVIGETYSTSKAGAIFEEVGQYSDNDYIRWAAFARSFITYFEACFTGRYIGDPGLGEASSLTTQDLFVFKFGSNLDLEGVKKIKKDYTKVYVFPPHTYRAGIELSKTIALSGFFDYSYTINSPNNAHNGVIYSSAYASKPHVGAFTLTNTNQIQVKTIPYSEFKQENAKPAKRNIIKKHMAGAAPSKDGKMVVYYYLNYKDEPKEDKKAIKKEEKEKNKKKGKGKKKKKKKGKKKSKKRKKGAIYYYVENI